MSALVLDDLREERRHGRRPDRIGKFDATFNNAVFKPLPVIKNMPAGAPLPPNSGATVGSMTITK